jgi:small subunit ribosomal protein S7
MGYIYNILFFANMSRRSTINKRIAVINPIYQDRLVNLFVHRILKNGKKFLAYRIVYRALQMTEKRTRHNPILLLSQAVQCGSPTVAVKAKRKGGSTYQIPIELSREQGADLAIRWILESARKRTGPNMSWQFSSELIDVARQTGQTLRKRDETHRMAEANRAFSHYR